MAYLAGTIASYDKLDLLGWAISPLPFSLLCIAAFQSQLLNLAAVRARSILTLERALLTATGPDDDHPRRPFSHRRDRQRTRHQHPHRIITLLSSKALSVRRHKLSSRNNLVSAHRPFGVSSEAILLFEATLADGERVLFAEHPVT